MADNERRLAAIMSADVAGYSKLMGAEFEHLYDALVKAGLER